LRARNITGLGAIYEVLQGLILIAQINRLRAASTSFLNVKKHSIFERLYGHKRATLF